MTKRSLIIGNTALGLDDAKGDANMVATFGERFLKFDPTAVVVGPHTDVRDVADLVHRFNGTDVCFVHNSSHGYSGRGANGKRECGLWWGVAVPYDTLFRLVINPLRAVCRYVIFANDACHSGAALQHPSAPQDAPRIKVKGLELVSGLSPLVEPEQFKVITPTSAIIASCGFGPNQFSYMGFSGGSFAEPWWPLSTHGEKGERHSLFTHCLMTTIVEDSCDFTNQGHKLPTIVQATRWRCRHMLQSWGTDPGWAAKKPAFPAPNVCMRKGNAVPPNIFTL